MENLWIPLILFYGIAKSFREALKKKAMESCSVIEVLFFYTLFAFVLTIPFAIGQGIFEVSLEYHLAILLKAFFIFVAWICALKAMKRLPLSLYCVLDMSRMLFSVILGIIFLGESLGLLQGFGLLLVLAGVALVNLKKKDSGEKKTDYKAIFLILFACFLNGLSAIIDKYTLSDAPNRLFFGNELLNDAQMQFWYMLYLTSFYGIYMLIRVVTKKESVDVKKCLKCPWIYLLSVLFMLADKAMFIANSSPNSSVLTLTVLQQVAVIVTIVLGKILYKEKQIWYRLLCAGLIITGIVLTVV